MANTFMPAHRIQYTAEMGETHFYYVAAENAHFAVADFVLRTNHPRDCVTQVDVKVGYKWVKVW